MKKLKPTKVPVMKEVQPYRDWRKEVEVWQAHNTGLGVAPRLQAGALFQSLQGMPRQIVLSELSVAELTADDGVTNIVNTLDVFFMGNKTQHAFNAIDELMTYKRGKDLSMQTFIMEFQLKNNRAKCSGINLPDDVLGYLLLKSANISDHKQDMVKATCKEFSYQTVKNQLTKIGLIGPDEGKKLERLTDDSSLPMKLESCIFGNQPSCNYSYCDHFTVKPLYLDRRLKISKQLYNKKFIEKNKLKSTNCNNPIQACTELDSQQLSLLVGETLGYALIGRDCPHTVSGQLWFNTYMNSLSRRDRQNVVIRRSNKKFCFKDGFTYESLSKATIPVYIGFSRYNLNVDIVSNNVPLILSTKTLKRANAKINHETAEIRFLGTTLPALRTSTGHLCLPLCRPLDTKNKESRNVISKVLHSPVNKVIESDLRHKAIKLHNQFCHPSSGMLIDFVKRAGYFDKSLEDTIREVTSQCEVCVQIKVNPYRLIRAQQEYSLENTAANIDRGNNMCKDVERITSDDDDNSSDDDDGSDNDDKDDYSTCEENNSDVPCVQWVKVTSKKDLPIVKTTVECKFPSCDYTVKCKVLSRAGKVSAANWHYMNIQEENESHGKCCSFKNALWRTIFESKDDG